jgi:exoribonuclease-2
MQEVEGTVLRENLLRLDGVPLVVRVPSLPDTAAGARVRLAVRSIDLLERVIDCTYRETLAGSGAALAEAAADSGQKA